VWQAPSLRGAKRQINPSFLIFIKRGIALLSSHRPRRLRDSSQRQSAQQLHHLKTIHETITDIICALPKCSGQRGHLPRKIHYWQGHCICIFVIVKGAPVPL